jgi:hypothetical protein
MSSKKTNGKIHEHTGIESLNIQAQENSPDTRGLVMNGSPHSCGHHSGVTIL